LSIWFIFSSTRTDNFQTATWDEAEEKLKHAYNLIELNEANVLEKRSMLVYGTRKHMKSILRFTQKLLNEVNKLKNLLVRVKVIPRSSDKLQGYWSFLLNLENLHYLLAASMLILNTLKVCSIILKLLHTGNKNMVCVSTTPLCASHVFYMF